MTQDAVIATEPEWHPAPPSPEPYLVLVADQLLLFHDEDEYGPQGPQCIAKSGKKRCRRTVQWGEHYAGWNSPFIPELGGVVSALNPGTCPDRCFIEQRCTRHLDTDTPNSIAPTWEIFEPERHRDLVTVHPIYTQTATGIRYRMVGVPDEGHHSGQRREPGAATGPADDTRALLERAFAERVDPPALTKLYTAHDRDGRLLYIGISDEMAARFQAHVDGSSWMEFMATLSVEEFPTRRAAEDAERERVKAGQPLFNVVHNDHPTRDADLIEYLIAKGRTDLLTLNVSRG